MATVYTGLEIFLMSESDRETFYAQMGHSTSINKIVYQSSLAKQAMTKILKALLEETQGKTSTGRYMIHTLHTMFSIFMYFD